MLAEPVTRLCRRHFIVIRTEQAQGGGAAHTPGKDGADLALEKALSDATGLKVTIAHGPKGGELKIAYRTLEQLDELCRRLGS